MCPLLVPGGEEFSSYNLFYLLIKFSFHVFFSQKTELATFSPSEFLFWPVDSDSIHLVVHSNTLMEHLLCTRHHVEDAEAWSRSSAIRGCGKCTQRRSIQGDSCQEKEPKRCTEELAVPFLITNRWETHISSLGLC